MSCTPLLKAVKPVWDNQITRRIRKISICVYYYKYNWQSVFAGFYQFLGVRGSEKAFNES